MLNKTVRFDLPPIPLSIRRIALLSLFFIPVAVVGYIFYIERIDANSSFKREKIYRFVGSHHISNLWFYSDSSLYNFAPDWVTAARFDIQRMAFDQIAQDMKCRQVARTRSEMANIRGWRPWWHPNETEKLKSYACELGHVLIDMNVDAQGPHRYRVWIKAYT